MVYTDHGVERPDIIQFLQRPLLDLFLIALDLIAHFKGVPVLEAHTAFSTLPHFGNILLLVFERGQNTCRYNVSSSPPFALPERGAKDSYVPS